MFFFNQHQASDERDGRDRVGPPQQRPERPRQPDDHRSLLEHSATADRSSSSDRRLQKVFGFSRSQSGKADLRRRRGRLELRKRV